MIISMSKGQQITIPAKIRNKLGLEAGSKIEIVYENKKIIMKPVGKDLDNVFKEAKRIKPKHKLTPAEMDKLNERLLR